MTGKSIKILAFLVVFGLTLVAANPSYAISFGGGGACGSAAGFSGSVSLGGVSVSYLPTSVGEIICNVVKATDQIPGFIGALAYLLGIFMGVFGVLKLKDHVLDPRQTPLAEAVKRFIAGGAFFALPTVGTVIKNTLLGDDPTELEMTAFSGQSAGPSGLDGMLVRMVKDLWEPLQIAIGAFGYLAGLVFVMIGISRLLANAQQGPRGPAGFGTIMTFLTAGALFSLDSLMAVFNSSMFSFAGSSLGGKVWNHAVLMQTTGDSFVNCHVTAVISAVLGFMILVGWISFVRGFFILRGVAEGSNQASLMGAMTHIIGGAIAVNLGPFINAVQSTFGLYGVAFTPTVGGGLGESLFTMFSCM